MNMNITTGAQLTKMVKVLSLHGTLPPNYVLIARCMSIAVISYCMNMHDTHLYVREAPLSVLATQSPSAIYHAVGYHIHTRYKNTPHRELGFIAAKA